MSVSLCVHKVIDVPLNLYELHSCLSALVYITVTIPVESFDASASLSNSSLRGCCLVMFSQTCNLEKVHS